MTIRNEDILNGMDFNEMVDLIATITLRIRNHYDMDCSTRDIIRDIEHAAEMLDENTYTCESCGKIIHSENVKKDDYGSVYCECCFSEKEEPKNIIKQYHAHKGHFKFLDIGEPFKIGYRGFELELESNDGIDEDFCNTLREYKDEFFFEEDGSLTNGVEVISNPMSREYWRTIGFKDISSLLEDLRNQHNIRSWKGGHCGLHVHFSRDEWDNECIKFIIKFIVANPDFIKSISGREDFEYCRIPTLDDYDLEFLSNSDRYLALNINPKTVEFRFFRGALRLESIWCSIEICDYLLQYAKIMSRNDMIFYTTLEESLKVERFLEYIKENAEDSNKIIEFIEHREHLYDIKH